MSQQIPQQTNQGPVTFPLLSQLMDRAGIQPNDQTVNMTWDELEDLYQVVANGLVNQAVSLNTAITLFKQYAYNAGDELIITIKGLTADIEKLTQELVTIRKYHKDKTGKVDDSEISAFLTIGSDYKTAADRIQSLLVNPMLTVTEYLVEMQQQLKLKEETDASLQKQKDLVDPTVISDVEVKTPVVEGTTNEQ